MHTFNSQAQQGEPSWPAALAVIAIIGLQFTLLEKLTFGPNWLGPALETLLLLPILIVAPKRHPTELRFLRWLVVVLIALINLLNMTSLGLLVHFLLTGIKTTGGELLFEAIKLWFSNLILFGVWYWELDRGGPSRRGFEREEHPDFLFPQMNSPQFSAQNWEPGFLDYVFLSFTNSTSFSPAETPPLTGRAKLLMMMQASISLLTVALILGRAVNILP